MTMARVALSVAASCSSPISCWMRACDKALRFSGLSSAITRTPSAGDCLKTRGLTVVILSQLQISVPFWLVFLAACRSAYALSDRLSRRPALLSDAAKGEVHLKSVAQPSTSCFWQNLKPTHTPVRPAPLHNSLSTSSLYHLQRATLSLHLEGRPCLPDSPASQCWCCPWPERSSRVTSWAP